MAELPVLSNRLGVIQGCEQDELHGHHHEERVSIPQGRAIHRDSHHGLRRVER